jgi:hypothetical protein
MTQLHKRISNELVAFLIHSCSQGLISRHEVQDTLWIGKTRLFELWKYYPNQPRPFSVPVLYSSPDKILCLCETRITNGYGRIPLFNHEIRVANVPLRQEVNVHLVPDPTRNIMQIRIGFQDALAHSVDLPLEGFGVHF